MGGAVLGYLKELGAEAPADAVMPPVTVPPPDVVTLVDRRPTCTCGWTGRRRIALFLAVHDAWMHAATTGCMPGVPLVR